MKWQANNIPLTAALLLITTFFFAFTNADLWIQNWLFDADAQRWLLDRHNQLAKLIFYDGVLAVFQVFVLSVGLSLLCARNKPWVKQHRRPLLLIFLSCLLVPGTVALMKSLTNMPCPKDLAYYGGIYPFIDVFSHYPESFIAPGRIKCFPAGHASSLFSLLSLYFISNQPRTRATIISLVLLSSWAIGIYKMLIGDHFFSHTLFTMLWAWLLVLTLQRIIMPESTTMDTAATLPEGAR